MEANCYSSYCSAVTLLEYQYVVHKFEGHLAKLKHMPSKFPPLHATRLPPRSPNEAIISDQMQLILLQLVCYKCFKEHSLHSSCFSEDIFFPPHPQAAQKRRTNNYSTRWRRRKSEPPPIICPLLCKLPTKRADKM